MKKALVVSYFFPPFSDSGVFRTAKFVKYLSRFGYEPLVLCADEPYALGEDSSLVDDIPVEANVCRAKGLFPMQAFRKTRHSFIAERQQDRKSLKSVAGFILRKTFRALFVNMMVPDMMVTWALRAYSEGKKICEKENVDVIFSTDPPSDYLLASFLSRKHKIPLVLDFRDSWTLRRYGVLSRGFLRRRVEKALENYVLKTASAVVFVNALMRERYAGAYPHYAPKFNVITNGFDDDDFPADAARSANRVFTLLHAGRLSEFQSPVVFFQSLHELAKEGKISAENFKAVFIGDVSAAWLDSLVHFHLENIVSVLPYKPHREIVKDMTASDALLLISGSDPEITTGKIYEYLAAGRPVLAFAPPDGEAARLIYETEAGIVAPPDNKENIKEALLRLMRQQNEFQVRGSKRGDILRFSRKNLTQQLCSIFDSALAGQRKI